LRSRNKQVQSGCQRNPLITRHLVFQWSGEVRRMTILIIFSTELLNSSLFRKENVLSLRLSENELVDLLHFVSRGERGGWFWPTTDARVLRT
jgi:hypothetical protein